MSSANITRRKQTAVKFVKYHGVPTLTINGKPHPGTMCIYYGNSPEYIRYFSKAGVKLFDFTNTASAPFWEGFGGQLWSAPDKFDYTSFDDMVAGVLKADPEAYILPRLDIRAPDWWLDSHPDDLSIYEADDGTRKLMPSQSYVDGLVNAGFALNSSMTKPMPSWASEPWRTDTCKALRELVKHVEQSPYADRVIGFHLASGASQEWFMWQSEFEGITTDFCKANTLLFRKWLSTKYRSDRALQIAWRQPAVTFETAVPPPSSVRRKTEFGQMRDPAKEQWTIDYLTYNSWMTADTIECLAQEVKKASGGSKLVGAAYGYVVGLAGEPRQQNSGHHDLDRLLHSPHIDFLYSPALYWEFRALGVGTPATMSLPGSVALHGKGWINETDFVTSITEKAYSEASGVDEDTLQQRRAQGWIMANGIMQGWFNVGSINYEHPLLQKEIAKLTALAQRAQTCDRSPVDILAFVVDPKSVFYHGIGDMMGRELLMMQLPALVRYGGASGSYSLSDLDKIRKHKVFLFANVMAPTDAERRQIDALKRDGNTLIFLYAPGVYRHDAIDMGAMRAMTGIEIKRGGPSVNLHITIKNDDSAYNSLNGIGYGTMRKVDPVFVADDPDAVVLGRLDDGRPGLVVKRHSNWTSIYSSSSLIPTELIRAIASEQGVHMYAKAGDALWATKEVVTISVNEAGEREIRLPEKRHVYDAYEARELGFTDSFTINIAKKDTRVFFTTRS